MSETDKSLGELRMGLDALYRKLDELEARMRELEQRTLTGTIDGLEGDWTVSVPPEFEP